MAEHETVFLLVLASVRRRSYLHVTVTRSRISSQEPATVAGPAMDLRAGYSSSQPIGIDALPCQAIEAVSTGFAERIRGGRQRLFIHWNRSIRDIMRSDISRWIVEVSSILEVVGGLPEFLSMRHGLYRWWDVNFGSSGGRTLSRGSRTPPTSIAYTICMQPLLWRA